MLSLAIGPFALSISHLLLFAALAVASLVAWKTRSEGKPDALIFWLFMLALLVARLAFVAQYWALYREQPWQVLDLRDGGFSPWVGLGAGVLAATLAVSRRAHLRRPLSLGVASGVLLWLAGTGLAQMHNQSTGFPQAALYTGTGKPVLLAEHQGQPMVVNLWATWCPPCRREMPVLVQAQQQNPKIRFVFVNQGESPDTVSAFLGAAGVPMEQVLFDPEGSFAREVGSMALPTTLFYSADGKLLGNHLGELSAASLTHGLEVFKTEP